MSNFYLFSYRWLLLLLIILTSTIALGQGTSNKDFLLQLDNFRGSIQWEHSNDKKTWVDIPSGNVGKLKLVPSQTTYYRARITEPNCSPVYSDIKAAFVEGDYITAAKLIHGKVALPKAASIKYSELRVSSLVDNANLKEDGSFELLIKDSALEVVLLLTNKKDEVIMLGYYIGENPTYELTSESTAIALLVLYPFLKPVDIAYKKTLIELYKQHASFSQLQLRVENVVSQSKSIFSSENIALATTMADILKIAGNNTRLRTTVNDPVEITSSGSNVTPKNNRKFSYSVGVFRKNATSAITTSINLAGSTLNGSIFLKQIVHSLQGADEVNSTRTIDLKALGLEPGEYEIRLRSGLAYDKSLEDNLAFHQNISEWLSVIIGNISFSDFIENECLKNLFAAFVNTVNPLNMAEAGRDKDITKYLLPLLRNYLDFAINNTSFACAKITPNRFIYNLYKSLSLAEQVYDKLGADFVIDWSVGPHEINACQFLDQNYTTSTCLIIEKEGTLAATNYVCDEVELKVKIVENKLYYPNTSEPIANRSFQWMVQEGGGAFHVQGAKTATGKTDGNGMASIKWIMPSSPINNLAYAAALLNKPDATKTVFTTSTVNYDPKIYVPDLSNKQTGKPGKPLPNPIYFELSDKVTGKPIFSDDYVIKPPVIRGGGSLTRKEVPLNLGVSYEWTLGPIEGEQTIEILVYSKPCLGQTEGLPIASLTFTATAIDKLITKISGDNQTGEVGEQLPQPLVVRIMDNESKPVAGIEVQWSTFSNSGVVWPAISKTDAKGETRANWVLGNKVGDQVAVAKANINNQEIKGSPIVFKAKAIEKNALHNTTWVGYFNCPDNVSKVNTPSVYPGVPDGNYPLTMKIKVNGNQVDAILYAGASPGYSDGLKGTINEGGTSITWTSGYRISGNITLMFIYPETWSVSGTQLKGQFSNIGNNCKNMPHIFFKQ